MPPLSKNQTPAEASRNRPTVPGEVTPQIPLEGLHLYWGEADLPQRERTRHVHGLHPFLGKFIPPLVEVFLRKYFLPGQTVLDPFCGSGTTLVQAQEQGIQAVGCDVSAFAVLLARVKTARYDLEKAQRESADLLAQVRRSLDSTGASRPGGNDPPGRESLPAAGQDYLRRWYAPSALRELLTCRRLIETEDYEYRDLLRVLLSRAARSARLTTHYELDAPRSPQTGPYWCYKHARTCTPPTTAWPFLQRYHRDTLRRLAAFAPRRTAATIRVQHADSRQVNFPPADGVITSPPYLGRIDYHEQHAYAYALLGLADHREQELGSAAHGSSRPVRQQFYGDLKTVFRRVVAALPPGAPLIVVTGDPAPVYEELAAALGVEVEGQVGRRVQRQTAVRTREFGETVWIWRKR